MGSRIAVDSREGRGSVFGVVLPLPPAEDPGTYPREAEPEPPSRPLRLLVADDNPINQRLLNAVLRGAGHSVEIATNGQETVDAVMSQDFDAILMDVQMP
jgi:PleD family two-component response regulator